MNSLAVYMGLIQDNPKYFNRYFIGSLAQQHIFPVKSIKGLLVHPLLLEPAITVFVVFKNTFTENQLTNQVTLSI